MSAFELTQVGDIDLNVYAKFSLKSMIVAVYLLKKREKKNYGVVRNLERKEQHKKS